MLRTFLLLAAIAVGYCAHSQNPTIAWGNELKLESGFGTEMTILAADASGVYLSEKGMVAPLITTARLVKLDNNLNEVYRKLYAREHKDKDFETFFACKDRLLIITSDYHRKEKSLEIFAAEVDKSSGELMADWKSIASIKKEERSQDIGIKLLPNADSTGFILFSAIVNNENYSFQVQEFNKELTAVTQPVVIPVEFLARNYRLEDVLYTTDKKIVLVGKVLLFPSGPKRASREPELANYHIRIYDEQGNQLNEVTTKVDGRWLMNGKVFFTNRKELVLAGFYSNNVQLVADGFLMLRINPSTGEVLSAAEKQLNYSMLTAGDGDDKNKKLAKQKAENAAFSKYMTFRNVFHTADGGLVLLAENYNDDLVRATPGYSMKATGGDLKNTYFEADEIMMCKLDAGNNLSWLHVLPKMQRESTSKMGTDMWGFIQSSPFFYKLKMPYFSGFGAMQHNGNINLFFNDDPDNANVLHVGEKVSEAKRMSHTHCYRITLNEITGSYQRNDLFDNREILPPMLRHATIFGNDMYIIGKAFQAGLMLGTVKLKLGKIAFE